MILPSFPKHATHVFLGMYVRHLTPLRITIKTEFKTCKEKRGSRASKSVLYRYRKAGRWETLFNLRCACVFLTTSAAALRCPGEVTGRQVGLHLPCWHRCSMITQHTAVSRCVWVLRRPDTGPHSCTASTAPTELSPQPQQYVRSHLENCTGCARGEPQFCLIFSDEKHDVFSS